MLHKQGKSSLKLTPDIRFLLDCTQSPPDTVSIERMREHLREGVDWMSLLRLAVPHGVLPLVSHAITRQAEDLLTPETLSHLQRVAVRTRERNTRQWLALEEVMNALTANGVRVLAYKGPVLSMLIHGDFALRESHDLDLWADPKETFKAGQILRSLGFKSVRYRRGEPVLTDEISGEITEFVSPDGSIVVDLYDLQLRPDHSFKPDFDEMWERRGHAVAFGRTIATLNREDLLLALAVHGSKHLWHRLNWVADIVALLSSSTELKWQEMFARAGRWRCAHRLTSALALTQILYGTTFPAEVETRIQAGFAQRDAASCAKMIVEPTGRSVRADIARFRHQYRNIDRPGDRMRFLRQGLEARIRRFPSTIRKRVRWSPRTFGVGSWRCRVPLGITFRVDLDAPLG